MKQCPRYVSIVTLFMLTFGLVSTGVACEKFKADLGLTVGVLADLHKYYGNTFVWQKKALKAGQTCSPMISQIPIKRYDGTVVSDKAVIICRGNIGKDGSFGQNKDGGFVKIDLYTGEEKMYDAGSIMMLTNEGAGAAASCWKDDVVAARMVPKYNCFFRVQPASDGGVLLRWTMYHPGSMTDLATVDPVASIMKGTPIDLKVVPSSFQLPAGSTFETK